MADEITSVSTTEGSAPTQTEGQGAAPTSGQSSDLPVSGAGGGGDLRSKINKMHTDAQAKSKAGEVNPPGDTGAGKAPDAATAAAQVAQAQAEAIAQAYKPNLKYKFFGQERDMEPWIADLLKDEETEKKVRDLVERAAGVDYYRPKYQELVQETTTLNKGLEVLQGHIEKKQYDKFFSAFGLTDLDVLRYAQERIKYLSLPADERAKIDEQNAQREQFEQAQVQQATAAEELTTLKAQNLDMGLRMVMQHPQVSPVVAQYQGGPQAFYRDVAQTAFVHEMTTGQELTADQAVMLFFSQRGLGAQPAAAAQSAPAPAQTPGAPAAVQTPASAPVEAAPAPTLPKVPGQGTSPAKKMVTSMADLKKRRAELEALNG